TNLHKERAFPGAHLSCDSGISNHSSILTLRCTAARFLMKHQGPWRSRGQNSIGRTSDEAHHGDHQTLQARRRAGAALHAGRPGHDGDGSQRLRAAEGPYGNLSRRGIRRKLPAQTQNRSGGESRTGERGDRRDRQQGQDRTDRRRKDLRHAGRSGRAHPYRRNRRRRALGVHKNSEGVPTMKITGLKKLGMGALAAGGALGLSTATAFAATAPKIDTGDTAWMLTSTALVLMMTIPGLGLFYGGMVRKKNVLATMAQ